MKPNLDPTPRSQQLEARVGTQLAAILDDGLAGLPPDVESRLRFAREQALARHAAASRVLQAAARPAVPARGVVLAGGGRAALGAAPLAGGSWWSRLGLLLPLLVVLAAILFVQARQQREAAAVAARIDSALLADELPPEAYADPGFVAFLELQQP